MTKHIEDVAAQTIALLRAAHDLCRNDKQRRALERARSWLLDVTNPLTEAEQEAWDESGISEDDYDTDYDRRDALNYLEEPQDGGSPENVYGEPSVAQSVSEDKK